MSQTHRFSPWRVAAGFVAVGAIGASAIWFASCGSSTGTFTQRSYAGAGSQWNISFTSATNFVITHAPSVGAATDLTVNGTYVAYNTGFMLMTVTSASAPAGSAMTPPAAGAQAFGLEITNNVFFLQPTGGGNLIAMIPSGNCPSATGNFGWIKMRTQSSGGNTFSATNTDLMGTATWTPATNTLAVANKVNQAAFSTGCANCGAQSMTITCASGVGTIATNGGADLFMTQSGGAIVHTGTTSGAGTDEIIFAAPQAASVTAASFTGNYAGLVFDSGGSGASNQNFPVAVTLAANGGTTTGAGYKLTDVTNGTKSTGGAYLTFNGTVSGIPGSVKGTIDFSSPTGGGGGSNVQNMGCIVSPNPGGSAQTVVACASVDPGGQFFSVILVSH